MAQEKTMAGKPELKIDENTFIYESTVIQLSNISQVKISYVRGRFPKILRAFLSVSLFIFILSAMFYNETSTYNFRLSNEFENFKFYMIISGIITLVLIIAWICVFFTFKKYIVLNLNSGEYIFFTSSDENFLKTALKAIVDCINNQKSYSINFENCTINESQIGNRNSMRNNSVI